MMEDECIFYLELNNKELKTQIKEIIKFNTKNNINYQKKLFQYEKEDNLNKNKRILSKSPNLSNKKFSPPPSSSYVEKLKDFMEMYKNDI